MEAKKEELYSDKYKTSDFCWGVSLGEGAFGNVKFAWLKKNPSVKVAIKSMKKNDIIQSKHVDHIENEKKILELLTHPFIMKYYGFM
jgi:serine/threonine protein kinase